MVKQAVEMHLLQKSSLHEILRLKRLLRHRLQRLLSSHTLEFLFLFENKALSEKSIQPYSTSSVSVRANNFVGEVPAPLRLLLALLSMYLFPLPMGLGTEVTPLRMEPLGNISNYLYGVVAPYWRGSRGIGFCHSIYTVVLPMSF